MGQTLQAKCIIKQLPYYRIILSTEYIHVHNVIVYIFCIVRMDVQFTCKVELLYILVTEANLHIKFT